MNYMKNMTFKEKLRYIKDYYKIHIIVAVLLVVSIGYFLYSQATQVEYILNVTIIENIIGPQDINVLEKEATEAITLGNSESSGKVRVELLPIGSDRASIYAQKLMAELATGGVDVLIVSKENFKNYNKIGAFARLDSIKQLDLKEYKGVEVKETNGIYGLSLGGDSEGDNQLRKMGLNTDNNILCIATNAKNHANAAKLIRWIYGK